MRWLGNYRKEDADEALLWHIHCNRAEGYDHSTILISKPKPSPGYTVDVLVKDGIVGLYDIDKRNSGCGNG